MAYWTFPHVTAYHDEEFPAHDFQTRFSGTLKEHPHCTRCHVPQGSSESKWNNGRCTHRTFFTVPAAMVQQVFEPYPNMRAGDTLKINIEWKNPDDL